MIAPTGQKTNESRAKGNPITKPNGLHSQNSPSIISLSSFSLQWLSYWSVFLCDLNLKKTKKKKMKSEERLRKGVNEGRVDFDVTSLGTPPWRELQWLAIILALTFFTRSSFLSLLYSLWFVLPCIVVFQCFKLLV